MGRILPRDSKTLLLCWIRYIFFSTTSALWTCHVFAYHFRFQAIIVYLTTDKFPRRQSTSVLRMLLSRYLALAMIIPCAHYDFLATISEVSDRIKIANFCIASVLRLPFVVVTITSVHFKNLLEVVTVKISNAPFSPTIDFSHLHLHKSMASLFSLDFCIRQFHPCLPTISIPILSISFKHPQAVSIFLRSLLLGKRVRPGSHTTMTRSKFKFFYQFNLSHRHHDYDLG